MRLTSQQQDALRRERGIFANEACDRCGKLLGSVRYTRKGEPGEWCSELCRDGVEAVEARRKGGRPRKYRNPRQQRRAHAEQQRAYRESLSVTKTPSQFIENTKLADSIFASPDYPTQTKAQAL